MQPVRLEEAWPFSSEHSQRHAQIQQAVSLRADDIRRCHQDWGPLTVPLVIYVNADGEFSVNNSQSEGDKCYAWAVRRAYAGPYICDFVFPYWWNGTIPLIGY